MAHKDQMLHIKSAEADAEVSAFERFETEIKNSLFGMAFIMLKNEDDSAWKFYGILFIEACQLFSLVFNPNISFPWKGHNVEIYFQKVLQTFQIVYWLEYTSWTVFLIIFYCVIALVLISLLLISFTIYAISNIFLYILECEKSNSGLTHHVFNNVKCWQELHILHAVFGIITFIGFILETTIIGLLVFEGRDMTNNPAARIHSRNEVWQNFFKLVCVVLTTFFIGDSYRWTFIIFMIICSVFLYLKFKNEKPYYHDIFNKITEVTYCILMWACFCVFIVMISEDTQFNGGMQAFIIIIPLIGIIVVTREGHKHTLLLKPIDEFETPEYWYLKIRYYIDMIQHKEISREAAVQLNGFIFHHEEVCTTVNCPLKNYMTNAISSLKDKKKKQQRTGSEGYNLLMNYGKLLFSQGVSKFPNSSALHIAHAIFLKDRLIEKATAINELNAAARSNPQFDEQFLIYRCKKMIEESNEISENGEAGPDAVSMLVFENHLQQLKEAIDKSAYLHMEFWLELLEPEPDLRKLDTTGVKINSTIMIVQGYWEKVQKSNPNVPKALKLYADYLVEILNNTEEASELLIRLKGNKFTKNVYSNLTVDTVVLGMGEICATMGGADGTPCIVADGNPGKVGEIHQYNLSACRLFGYTKAELTGKKINILMPEVYANYHDNILQQSIERTESVGSGRTEKFILGRHKSGYLLPLPLQTRIILLVNQGTFLIATFRYERKSLNATYLLLNDCKDIVGLTSRGIKSLGITNHMLKDYRVSILTLAPGLNDKSMAEQFASKNGGNIEFYRPDTEKDDKVNNINESGKSFEFTTQFNDASNKKLHIKASKDVVRMNCIMTEIIYNSHTMGSIVRLEPVEDLSQSVALKSSKPQANPQFVFDPAKMSYLQENCEEDAQELISKEMSEYVSILRDRDDSSYKSKSDGSQGKINASAVSKVERSKEDEIVILRQKIEFKKKAYIEGVESYRWINGQKERIIGVKSRLLEKETEEQKALEELHIKEEKTKVIKDDAFSALKSHKIFIETLNDHTTPPSVLKVKLVGYVFVLGLLALCSVEFGLSLKNFGEIDENLMLIMNSYRQIALQMQVVYYTSKIVLLLKVNSPKYNSLDLPGDIATCKKQIELALNEQYDTQKYITLSTISMSEKHSALFKNKLVSLYYMGSSLGDNSEEQYTLPEAIQQMSSEIFTVLSFDNNDNYKLNNDDVYFVLYNGFADLYTKMKTSTNYYVEELVSRGKGKHRTMLIIFIVTLVFLALFVIVLFPLIGNVSHARLSVLALFFDLTPFTVRELQQKCSKFVSQAKEEEAEVLSLNESNAYLNNSANPEATSMVNSGTTRKRRYKNNKASNATFFLNLIIGILVIAAYFSVNFTFGYYYLKSIKGYSRELNATSVSQSEAFYAIAILEQLLGFGYVLTMTPKETFEFLGSKEITELYSISQETQISHNENGKSFTGDYQDAFINIMRNDLCNYKSQFDFTFSCETFLEGTTKEGLHPVIINFIENIREILTQYNDITQGGDPNANVLIEGILNSADFSGMEISVFDIADPSLRYLVDELINSHNTKGSNYTTQRVILYIVFLFLVLISYLTLWGPAINRFSSEVILHITIDMENTVHVKSHSL